jgi:molybdopterin converting factor small subunit
MSTSRQTNKTVTDSSSIAQSLSSSADTTDLVEAVTALATEVADLREKVEDQQQTINDQQQTISELREDLRREQDTRGREVAQTRQQVEQVRETVEETVSGDANPIVQAEQTTTQEPSVEPQTDIEQMVRMPDSLLEDQTANVRRAVFVASDVEDYTTSCPAGRVIKSGELRRVLRAGTDCAGHTQTVARVIDLLDRTGGDGTTVVERRGERRLVFEQDLVDRLSAQTQRCDGQPVEAT